MLTGTALIQHPRRVMAVDPGLSGAVCAIGRGSITVLRDFKKASDISEAVRACSGTVDEVWIELVSAMPGQGVVSMFAFGKATGVAIGSIHYARPDLSIHEVAPVKWQNFIRGVMGIPPEEDFCSTRYATQLLPQHADLFTRVKDHNTADAVLIAAAALLGCESSQRKKRTRRPRP